jgi:hypothetical protein
VISEGEIVSGPSQVFCPLVGADQVRSKIPDQTERVIYLEAATWHASLRRLSLNGDELFDRFAEPGFLELSVGEIEQADDNRSRRPCCFLIGSHHVRGGRLSCRAELRCRGAAMGDQAISAKIRVTEIFIFPMISNKQ